MTSAKTSGFVSGASQGAAIGFMAGGPVGAAVGGVAGGLVGLMGGSAQDAQVANQQAWQQYNAVVAYNTNIDNIGLSIDLGGFNATMATLEGKLNASRAEYAADVNADLIQATTSYNDLLYENDLTNLWNAAGLDMYLMATQRAVERGEIVAAQAASGTVIGTGSNEDVLISQKTQEIMDNMVVQYNADSKAMDILNSRAQSKWSGEVAEAKTRWEGETASFQAKQNATFQSMSITGSTALSAIGSYKSAESSLSAGISEVAITGAQASYANTQNMVSGLFSAAGTYASSKVGAKASAN